jgi:hypothetical protein
MTNYNNKHSYRRVFCADFIYTNRSGVPPSGTPLVEEYVLILALHV